MCVCHEVDLMCPRGDMGGCLGFVSCHDSRTKAAAGLLVVRRAAFCVTFKSAPASNFSICAGKGVCPTSHVQKAPRVKLSVSRGFFKLPRPARPACRLARKIGRLIATCNPGNIASLTTNPCEVLGNPRLRHAACSLLSSTSQAAGHSARAVCLGL